MLDCTSTYSRMQRLLFFFVCLESRGFRLCEDSRGVYCFSIYLFCKKTSGEGNILTMNQRVTGFASAIGISASRYQGF